MQFEEPSWREQAACKDMDPEIFFPEKIPLRAVKNAAVARAIIVCSECPVKEECLRYAQENKEYQGIWGGVWFGEDRIGASSNKKRNTA